MFLGSIPIAACKSDLFILVGAQYSTKGHPPPLVHCFSQPVPFLLFCWEELGFGWNTVSFPFCDCHSRFFLLLLNVLELPKWKNTPPTVFSCPRKALRPSHPFCTRLHSFLLPVASFFPGERSCGVCLQQAAFPGQSFSSSEKILPVRTLASIHWSYYLCES